MLNTSIREALLNREATLGTWIQLGHAGVAEVLSEAGFDWIAVDCEHTDIDFERFTDVARGMKGRTVTPMVRVGENDPLSIRRFLDAGAAGVIVPMVNTPDEARQAVRAAKFPPDGCRGFGFARMNDYGENFHEYAETANERIAVIVMAETKESVDNIGDIVAVDGVDGVFVGPYDMSGSYGVPGQTDHPDVKAGCRRVLEACRRSGIAAGIHLVKPTQESIDQAIADGFSLIALGVDTVFLGQASREVLDSARASMRSAEVSEDS